MKYELEHTFDLESLERNKDRLIEIQQWATMHRSDTHDLHHMIDHLCRVAHMYNMAMSELVRTGRVVGDPQEYIDEKLSIPLAIHRRLKNKQESN